MNLEELGNVTWGAPKIASELALLGFEVADSTVAKYMVVVANPVPCKNSADT